MSGMTTPPTTGTPTPETISRSTSSSSFLGDDTNMRSRNTTITPGESDEEEYARYSSDTSTSTNSRARSRSPVPLKDERIHLGHEQKNGLLAPPSSSGSGSAMGNAWRTISRSPSPLGLIPIHRTFSSLIHKHEVPRKLLHVSIGFLVLHLYRSGTQPPTLITPLTGALVPIATADLARFYIPSFNALYIRLLGALMRESEVRGWNGVVWYLVGTITVLTIFPKDVATLSILLLSWCDTAASTCGRAWGRYTPRIRRGKSLAGSLAAAVVGAVTAGMFWGVVVPNTPRWSDDPVNAVMWNERLGIEGIGFLKGGVALGVMSLMTGLIASASEVLDAWGLDDNVVIPVVSAVGVWGVLKLFG